LLILARKESTLIRLEATTPNMIQRKKKHTVKS
jgi:hypothetical protein